MNPLLDQILVAALVLAALAYLAARFLRRKGKNCGGDCCGAAHKPSIEPRRRGEKL